MLRAASHYGFTLLETLISLAVFSMIASAGFGYGLSNYDHELARSDRSSLF